MLKDILSSVVFVFILGSVFFFWDQKTDKELIKSDYICVATSGGELGDENFIFASTKTAYSKVLKPDGVDSMETLSCQTAGQNKITGYYPLDINKKVFMLTYHKVIYANLDKDIKIISAEDALQQLTQKGLSNGQI